ncbi:MAG: PAS domain-containing protein [Methanoregula sp.]|nr:PAS domain-containing protein [Methanoregula sp.]
MKHYQDEISRISNLLRENPKGLTIREISQLLGINRISAARYLESLLFSGQAVMRRFGPAKVYSQASRIPVSHILNLLSSPALIIDSEFFIKDANDRALTLCNAKRENLVGHHIRYTNLGSDSPEEISRLIPLVFDGKSYTEERSLTFNGRNCTFLMKLIPIVDENGKTCAALVFEDISTIRQYQKNLEELVKKRTVELDAVIENLKSEIEEKKQTLGNIRISQKKYRELVEDMPAYICTFEPDGTLTFVNEGFCQLVLKDASDLIGNSLYDMMPHADVKTMTASLERLTSRQESITDIKQAPLQKGGTSWQQWITRAFFDKRGKITEYQSIGIDISERIRAEQDLTDQRAKLDAIIRGSPLPQIVIDSTHRIVFWNTAMERFTGIPADAMIGTITKGDFVYDHNRPLLADLIADEMYSEISQRYSLMFHGSTHLNELWAGITFSPAHSEKGTWIYLAAAAIRDASGKITHVVETMEALVEFHTPDGKTFVTCPSKSLSESPVPKDPGNT